MNETYKVDSIKTVNLINRNIIMIKHYREFYITFHTNYNLTKNKHYYKNVEILYKTEKQLHTLKHYYKLILNEKNVPIYSYLFDVRLCVRYSMQLIALILQCEHIFTIKYRIPTKTFNKLLKKNKKTTNKQYKLFTSTVRKCVKYFEKNITSTDINMTFSHRIKKHEKSYYTVNMNTVYSEITNNITDPPHSRTPETVTPSGKTTNTQKIEGSVEICKY